MAEVSPSSPIRSNSGSPPPKCAICLGTCTNKCYSNSCMHQFCFTCLLEWSKVKAECPLCKQSFKSIIHNIKSNDEYDEHIVTHERNHEIDEGFFYLPPAVPSRHFQFRTTFTVDPGGELAIQQMLLSHPLTNNIYNVPGNYILPRQRYGRPRQTRRASSATSFRRSIYLLNLWVYAPPDVTGRYRDISPQFYRDNPAARNRLVPWLNRELNALLRENTQQVMNLVDIIMDHLPRWHIRNRFFRDLLNAYLTEKTDHFIHEFYNFMRSPYDMIGYDRHIVYSNRPHSPTYLISDNDDDDSDVTIVNVSEPIAVNNNPFRRPTLEVIEINSDSSDSDVIIREPPAVEVVNLVDSDTDDAEGLTRSLPAPVQETPANTFEESEQSEEVNRKPVLPLKIRLKRKRQTKEKRSRNKKRTKRHTSTTSSSSSSSDSYDSSSSNGSLHKRSKRRHKYRKSKSKDYKVISKERTKLYNKAVLISDSGNSDSESNFTKQKEQGFDSDDNLPLSKIKNKELKQKSKKHPQHNDPLFKNHTITSRQESPPPPPCSGIRDIYNWPNTSAADDEPKPSCSQWKNSEISGNSSGSIYDKFNPINCTTNSPTISNDNPLPSTSSGMTEYFSTFSERCMYDMYANYTNNSSSSLPQIENIPPYDTFQQCSYHQQTNCFSPVIGSRYYDGPDFNIHRSGNFSPPRAHCSNSNLLNNYLYRGNCHYNNLQQDCPHFNYEDNKLNQNHYYQPVTRVNVGVGTSPIKNEVQDSEGQNYNYHSELNSNKPRLQSVIVKMEENKNSNQYPFNNPNPSDSDN